MKKILYVYIKHIINDLNELRKLGTIRNIFY
jgi:hypothetical protein